MLPWDFKQSELVQNGTVWLTVLCKCMRELSRGDLMIYDKLYLKQQDYKLPKGLKNEIKK